MHIIRLRGPWEAALLASGSSEPLLCTLELPASWAVVLPAGGNVRLLRRFGLPTGIEPQDCLTLVVDPIGVEMRVKLNGEPLGMVPDTEPGRFDVTSLLLPRNELTLAAAVLDAPGEELANFLVGQVRLEISPATPPLAASANG